MQDRGLAPELQPEDALILQQGRPDFIAINYYSTATIAASRGDGGDVAPRAGDQQIMLGEEGVYRPAENPWVGKTPYGWVVDPVGLRLTLRKVCERYGLPILISENGMGAPDKLAPDGTVNDDYRIAFLQAHIEQMRLAIADGVELMGYCPWAAIDVVSTHQGYAKRYGIELPEEEAGNIAFHLVNGQSEGDDVAQTMQSVKMLKDIFNLVQYHFKQQIDTDSINYSRFLVHMQFFLQRLQEGELDGARDSFLLVQVIKEYPEAYRCALLIRDYVKAQLDITLGGNELLWLTVHLVRIAGLDA